MFNHECTQRNGEVVGACMDGFLFGACCQLPLDMIGELMESDVTPTKIENNNLYSSYIKTTSSPSTLAPLSGLITSSGVSQITNALLNGVIPTAQDNAVVQVDGNQYFSTTGVTHPTAPDTILINHNNVINSDDFKMPSTQIAEDRKTTVIDQTTPSYKPELPIIQISISNPPYYTQSPGYHKPLFVPKPVILSNNDKYVLVPTISNSKPNKTQEFDSIVNILHMLNESTTAKYGSSSTKKPPSTSYVFSSTSTRRPGYKPETRTTTKKAPSHVSSTSAPPRKSSSTTQGKPTYVTKRPSTSTKPVKISGGTKPHSTKKPISTTLHYIPSSTFRPLKTTYANRPEAFTVTKKPPSTSYVYSSTVSKRPTTSAYVAGPTFSVTPSSSTDGSSSPPPPTVIVLGPLSTDASPKPPTPTTIIPIRKPVSHVTINNHITQNIYSSERPLPTVLITPKPSTTFKPLIDDSEVIETATSPYDMVNFPPVRNPNLNMSVPVFDEDESTPPFIEDDVLNKKVESLVNKIIQGLQEPFSGLKDVVYNKNKTSSSLNVTTKKPIKKQGTTKRPTTKPGTSAVTSGRPPSGRPPSGRPSTPKPINQKKTTTKRPTTISSTKKPTTTIKKTKPPKKITTTPLTTEAEEVTTILNSVSNDYKTRKYNKF